MRIGMLAGAILTCLGSAPVARSAAEPLSIGVACEELSAEERANVEAMVRADLLARGSRVLRVTLQCQASWVAVRFDVGAEELLSHEELKVSARDLIAEQLIALTDHFLKIHGDAAWAKPESTIPPSEAPIGRDSRENSPAPSPPVAQTEPSSPLERMHPTAAPPRTLNSSGEGLVARETPHPVSESKQPVPGSFELLAGFELEPLLTNAPQTLLGPRVGVALRLNEYVAVEAFGTINWLVVAPNGIGLRDHRAGLGVTWLVTPHWSVGLGALLSRLRVSVPASLSPRLRWSSFEPLCQLSFGYRWSFGPTALSVLPTATLYETSRSIRLDGKERVIVPRTLVGVVVQTATGF